MLSIITPVYNSEKYLDECLQSLENQTKSEFEIILVDDGSTDLSGLMCDEFAQTHDNVRVVHTENQGLLIARRTGIKYSKGNYLAFLDSDDCIASSFVAEIEEVISEHDKPDIIAFDFSRGETLTYNGIIVAPGLPFAGDYCEGKYFCVKNAVCDGTFNNMANKVIKREVIRDGDDYSIFRGLMHGEDWFQMISIVENAQSAFYLKRPLYFYRISTQSSTHTFKISQLNDLLIVFNRLLNASAKWGDTYLQRARLGACRHIFMLISAVAVSREYSSKEKETIMKKIADLIWFVCKDETNVVFSKLRIDYSLTLRFAVAGKTRLSMFIAKLSVGLYNKLNHIR